MQEQSLNILNFVSYSVISAVICAFIDYMRIRTTEGTVLNISKSWTVFYGGLLCFVGYCIFNNNPQTFLEFIIGFITYCISFASIRGVIYDPSLNLMRGKKIDYESNTTNSKIDHKEVNLSLTFWKQRALYLILAIIFTILYKQQW
jgi:hypothetical protein